ncbi:MAG: AEC family transporter, partial [Lachnospiraceae bacterium]|nr:AEC family transporter [Lachnospiraceae bacterium]
KIMNPLLIIDGVLGKENAAGSGVLRQNILLMVIYYIFLLIISFPVAKLLREKNKSEFLYRLMMIFSNVGFMGIPVITSLYGDGCVLYIAFYILGYNLLLYTYGLYLVDSSVRCDEENAGKKDDKTGFSSLKKIMNSGVIACIIAIIIFAFSIPVPGPVVQFVNSLGNCAVPLSMVLIGASMAQQSIKNLVSDKKVYLFLFVRMIVIPIIAAFVMRSFSFDRQVAGVFGMMLAMPVGSIVVLLAQERGADETVCTRASVVSTVASVFTIPIVAAFLP